MFFECEHRTVLDLEVLRRNLEPPPPSDLERRILEYRGREHEARVLQHFESSGRTVETIAGGVGDQQEQAVAATRRAMERGVDVIYQGALRRETWVGRPDFLVRTSTPPDPSSAFGPFLYEPVDAKLARQEKARAVLQLCSYADQLEGIQGVLPRQIWLALGAAEVALTALNAADYLAYFARAKANLEAFVGDARRAEPYPEPVEFCDVCQWWQRCEARRRTDDHLSLVAGITRRQRSRLEQSGVKKLAELAALPEDATIAGIDEVPLARVRHQARLQYDGRSSGKPLYDLLEDFDPGSGLELLPVPRPGDLFLDLEGDAFATEGGLEYLFGLLELGKPALDSFVPRDRAGEPHYVPCWAKDLAEEKTAFEAVVDRIKVGRLEFHDMHVFHFGHRENEALKKLSCKHGTREDDIDEFLRAGVLVDLHEVVRHALRASVEAYTLKDLEILHDFQRTVSRRETARAMLLFGWWLHTGEAGDELPEIRETLARYNEEDCRSTWLLRAWLEARRPELEAKIGRPLTRPAVASHEDSAQVNDRRAEEERVAAALRRDLPADPTADTPEQAARRLLADLVGWHWRELKSGYWEYFQARELPPSDWLESRFVLADLSSQPELVGSVKRSHVYRYTFPEQEHAVRKAPTPEIAGTDGKKVMIVEIGPDYVDIKRTKGSADPHLAGLRPGSPIRTDSQAARLLDIARSVVAHGLEGNDQYRPALGLLLRRPPKCGQAPGSPLVQDGEDTVDAVKRLCLSLDGSVLAIQGPPGSGKTYCAAEAILALVRTGRRVGVTANSHQVITLLLTKVHEAAARQGPAVPIQHMAKADRFDGETFPFVLNDNYENAAARLAARQVQVMGGTSFAWAKEIFKASVDVLFVEEAGQLSLANVLAVSQAAKSVVLVGDPAQLEQPQKGTHPPGADVSSLEYLLGEAVTMPLDLGVFLPETRRLHPDICSFTSRIFYEDRLKPLEDLEKQCIKGPEPFSGSGLRYVPVEHTGNTNRSDEEVDRIDAIVRNLFEANATFQDKDGQERRIGDRKEDVLVVAPYNAQVAALKARLPEDRVLVGTVDRFQGKEAPMVIYSMTTSSGDQAPRGLEFLYSLNRFNVATSRAQALVILVASPALVGARCRTPRQLKLVNALCAYLERAVV